MENASKSVNDFLGPILDNFSGPLMTVLGALLILFIGWMIAKAFRRLTENLLSKTSLDEKLLGAASVNPGKMVGTLVYYLIMLVVLMVVLERLGMSYALDPVKNMVNEFTSFIPNMIGAGVIGFVGYVVAQICSGLVGTSGNAITNVASKLGLGTDIDIVGILQKLLFGFILAIFGIIALEKLNIPALSEPAADMLAKFIDLIPRILIACIIVGLFIFIARFISNLLADVLKGMKVDDMSNRLGLSSMLGSNSLADIISKVAFFFIGFIGLTVGISQLGLPQLDGILNRLLNLSGSIAFGLVIIIAGNFIAGIAAKAVGASNEFLGTIVRFALLAVFVTMGFSQMGIGGDIVENAFTLVLAAVAVAIGLSYGLGGREAAGEHMKDILNRFRKK